MSFLPDDISVPELLALLSRGGQDALDASLVLGLLLEDRLPHNDDQLHDLIGPALAQRRFTDLERRDAINGLTTYLRAVTTADPAAVSATWALSKSLDPSITEDLLDILDRFTVDPDADRLVAQAAQSLGILASLTTAHRDKITTALQHVAHRGHADAAAAARHFLTQE